MMLAAPPAAAITYVKPSSGLEPSVYGGGGSPSSRLLMEDSALLSCGNAALTCSSRTEGAIRGLGGADGAIAGTIEGLGSVMRALSFSRSGGK